MVLPDIECCRQNYSLFNIWETDGSGESADPTPQGETILDAFHPYGRVKRLRAKPVEEFDGKEDFLRILQAEKENLLKVNIEVVSLLHTPVTHAKLLQICSVHLHIPQQQYSHFTSRFRSAVAALVRSPLHALANPPLHCCRPKKRLSSGSSMCCGQQRRPPAGFEGCTHPASCTDNHISKFVLNCKILNLTLNPKPQDMPRCTLQVPHNAMVEQLTRPLADLYLSTGMSLAASAWNKQREAILAEALEARLLPAFCAELRARLLADAREAALHVVADRLWDCASRAPLQAWIPSWFTCLIVSALFFRGAPGCLAGNWSSGCWNILYIPPHS